FDATPWRDFPRMTARLDLAYTDGTTETITTDGDWRCVASPILYDCIRQGEVYDANCRGEDLGPAAIVDGPAGVMTAEQTAPTMIVEEFRPKAITQVGQKTWVVDLGKDISGWCRYTFRGLGKGQTVRMRYSERALEDGSIERSSIDYFEVELSPAYVAGEMGQFQSDIYIASGAGAETYQPHFSYNGFQYVEISGLDEAPSLDDITACVVSNAFPKTGSFACSNEMVNALQAAAELSYRGNYVAGFPTDCPHREKNGWMGDAQLASELAMYNFDNTACYEKWLADIRDAQKPNGDLPGIVPTGGWGYQWGNGPAWDSALVIIPWMNYIYKGDKKILEDNYEAIRRYVDYMGSRADGRFLLVHGLCDWIPIKTETTAEVTSTGYWINDVKTAARIAEILGRPEDAARFNELEGKIREAFKAALVKDDGTVQVGSQTAQSCALYQGLLLGEDADKAFDRLIERIASDGALDIGILGSKYLFRTLSERSRGDLALGLILQEGPHSFTDWIVRGGGTLWEDWGDGESRNHIMFGDFSAWFY
ncbi:MAG: family 78 glycoside hydrolase catalytic domain, partial [Thermoguttaceae bacterium]|nr:family 78 glycoside hydrolase catalytic domain [Thermoguttaceae bacterium]